MNVTSLIRKPVKALALFAMLAALPMVAQAKTPSADNQLTYEPQLDNQRDPNQYCAKCHKFDKVDKSQTLDQSGGELHFGKFRGTHLSQKNPNNGKPITCVNCHGNISEDHRRGAKDVMLFEGDIFGEKKPMYSAQEQNQVCFSCHQPDKLREKFWAHDVHAMKLPCASCHTLHPKADAMKDIEPKNRVKLCVDCHGKQQAEQQKRKAQQEQTPSTEQKGKQ
ncbi:cytochrome c nitrite reductase pentaheme subunit [Aggregatibacter actinomycetemcomitans]|uniref:cytochrome c nitrite reductase pentaheme subunit n=1 Tax=Aggregatibacter actinomycetemcomitans TaxID=714 RepID=UPI00077EA49B|nr:cytochrome c nitrite reductase pentaheme subunit [Aggregatibacter actinomycetemcomitans]KYK89234.1 cysteine dioxygenase [Aggregatibacter actinomycetemcomitans serotype f str. SC29R]